MISVSDPPSVKKIVPDPATGSGDGAPTSSARCDVLVEAEPVFRVVLRLDFHKTPVIRSKTGAGQRGTLFAVAGEVEIDAAVMAEALRRRPTIARSEEHTSELQSLMRISYAVFCLQKQKKEYL